MVYTTFDTDFGWHEIEDHTLTLRGFYDPLRDAAAASIKFVADSVLARPDSIHSPAAIGFAATIDIDGEVQCRKAIGDYGSLVEQRASLAALRNGKENEAKLSMLGLDLHIYQHQWGARSGLCVEGIATSGMKASIWPWPKREHEIGDWLLNGNGSAYCLRFAFLTSLVDPPYIDSFIHDFDSLIRSLSVRPIAGNENEV